MANDQDHLKKRAKFDALFHELETAYAGIKRVQEIYCYPKVFPSDMGRRLIQLETVVGEIRRHLFSEEGKS